MSRMFGWDLPPGCRESDIPGNRPEDLKEEAFIDALNDKLDKEKLDLPEEWADGDIWRLVILARDMGYDQGFSEGRDEAMMEIGSQEDGPLPNWPEDGECDEPY